MDKRLFLILSIFLFASCSWVPNLGKNKAVYGNKSDRVSILKETSAIRLDSSLDGIPVKIPAVKHNDKWYKSSGYDSLTSENIRAPKIFNARGIEKIGKGAKKGEHLAATPVIANGKLYVIDAAGTISALDVKNIRKKVWEYKIDIKKNEGNFANAGLLYSQGRIFISTGYNRVIALNAENGKLIWRRNINSIARSAPAAGEGVLLVNTIDNKLYALDMDDGAILWNHSGVREEVSIFGSTSPVVYNNTAFASYSSGEIYALNLKNGNEIWYDTLSDDSAGRGHSFSDISSPPVIVGTKIYVISSSGALTSYGLYDGSKTWENEVLADKTPWYAGDFIYLINENKQLLCLYRRTGGVKWIKQLPSYQKPARKLGEFAWSGPVMAADSLIVVGAHGKMLSISPKDGEVVSITEILSGVNLPPVVAHDTVFLLTDNAKLVAYRNTKDNNKRSKSLTEIVADDE